MKSPSTQAGQIGRSKSGGTFSTDSAERPTTRRSPPPLQLNVCRRLRECDAVWYHRQIWVCVLINDCSAKLVQVTGDLDSLQVNEVDAGLRISTAVNVGHPDGPSAFRDSDTSTFWLVGQVRQAQITRREISTPLSRERVFLGTVDVPKPGFAPKSHRYRAKAAHQTESSDCPNEPPMPRSTGLETCLGQVAAQVAAMVSGVDCVQRTVA